MDRVRHFFLHNTELLLNIICWIFHAFFASFSGLNNYHQLAVYNVTVSFAYATFILLFKNLKESNIFFWFFYFESLVYSIVLTICTGVDFGGSVFCVSLIPLLFLTTIDKRYDNRFYILHIIFAIGTLLFIQWWSYIRTGLFSLEFVTALTIRRSFYIAHIVATTLIVAIFLFYYSILTEFAVSRSRQKAVMQAEQLDYKANHDPLTGLMNRRKFNVLLKQAQYEKELNGKDYALTIFDIDGFKKINDTYGHDAGDYILQNMTAFIAKMLDADQQFARWGGEEFIILFPDSGQPVIEKLESICAAMAQQTFRWQYTDIRITLTFGLSCSKKCDTSEKMIIEADNRLMWGKQHGKNQVVTEKRMLEGGKR